MSPNVEFFMPPRLANAWANWARAMGSLRHRIFRRTPKSEQALATEYCQHCPHCSVRASKRVDDHRLVPTSKQEGPDSPEFNRRMSQVMETMLKSMILASGGNVEGRSGRP